MSVETLSIVALIVWNAALTWWVFNWYIDITAQLKVHTNAIIQVLVRLPDKEQREIQERISELTKNAKRNA
jgi:hypothetical protein